MKTFLLWLTLAATVHPAPKTTVYYCDSPTGKKYHLRNDCRGLNRCTHRILEATLEEAKKKRLEICGFER
jgi:hypothetical protein